MSSSRDTTHRSHGTMIVVVTREAEPDSRGTSPVMTESSCAPKRAANHDLAPPGRETRTFGSPHVRVPEAVQREAMPVEPGPRAPAMRSGAEKLGPGSAAHRACGLPRLVPGTGHWLERMPPMAQRNRDGLPGHMVADRR